MPRMLNEWDWLTWYFGFYLLHDRHNWYAVAVGILVASIVCFVKNRWYAKHGDGKKRGDGGEKEGQE